MTSFIKCLYDCFLPVADLGFGNTKMNKTDKNIDPHKTYIVDGTVKIGKEAECGGARL